MESLELCFKWVKTEQDYFKLRSTGMAFELFPELPATYEQYVKALEEWESSQ